MDATGDDVVEVSRQFGLFFRRAERFYASLQFTSPGRPLERAAYQLLGRIAGAGPARLSALAADLYLDLSTVSRQVAALEAGGLVQRTADPSDRRASLIEATPVGHEVFGANRAKWLTAWHDLLDEWTPEERQTFARLFARLNETIAERLPVTGERDTR